VLDGNMDASLKDRHGTTRFHLTARRVMPCIQQHTTKAVHPDIALFFDVSLSVFSSNLTSFPVDARGSPHPDDLQ
jgi:hypothetical protein